MTLALECRLWGDRLADGVEAKRALCRYWLGRAAHHYRMGNVSKGSLASVTAYRIGSEIAAVEAAAQKRR